MALRNSLGKLSDGSEPWEGTSEDLSGIIESTPDDGISPYGVSDDLTPGSTEGPDAHRGRHVGRKALALIQRFPLVGLRYLSASEELSINDDLPPPQTGNYAVAPLGITTLEYDGIKQNHLLVTFKAGELTGWGQEDDYSAQDFTLPAGTVDYALDVATLLKGRSGRTLVIQYDRNISVKVNAATNNPMSRYAVQSPYIIDLGLNIKKVYISATNLTRMSVEVW